MTTRAQQIETRIDRIDDLIIDVLAAMVESKSDHLKQLLADMNSHRTNIFNELSNAKKMMPSTKCVDITLFVVRDKVQKILNDNKQYFNLTINDGVDDKFTIAKQHLVRTYGEIQAVCENVESEITTHIKPDLLKYSSTEYCRYTSTRDDIIRRINRVSEYLQSKGVKGLFVP